VIVTLISPLPKSVTVAPLNKILSTLFTEVEPSPTVIEGDIPLVPDEPFDPEVPELPLTPDEPLVPEEPD